MKEERVSQTIISSLHIILDTDESTELLEHKTFPLTILSIDLRLAYDDPRLTSSLLHVCFVDK